MMYFVFWYEKMESNSFSPLECVYYTVIQFIVTHSCVV